ncbi:hypothetical protein EJ04DRAFT_504788 [Polyplosphaeria fusca]|uniref:Small secreted protein n=1 Tax=Polyplosphaeria fusca TaxID=682080 RepID=A0A9P4UXA9_9PLEO|nr:hypothetical protein EJ04DRAFT_504788 [Polyplosphaeria fusca]
MHPLALFSLLTLLSTNVFGQSDPNTTYLTATALVTKNNASAFECWQLNEPFKRSSVPGVSGAQVATIGNYTDLGYTILPPRYDGGIHTAPVPQLVHYVSGLAYITFPGDDTSSAFFVGGIGGLLFAADTTGTGHITRYPSDEITVAITAPFEDGKIPGHVVLGSGACAGKQTFV